MRPVYFAALALTLSACASTGRENPDHADLQRMAADCQARGGILVPTGELTGRPQVDYACRISGGASRISGSH